MEGDAMPVVDLAARRVSPVVEVDTSTAYELLLSLCLFNRAAECMTFDVGCAWFERVRAAAPPDLLAAVARFDYGTGTLWEHFLGLVYESPPPTSIETFLAHLATLPPLDVRLYLLGYYLPAIRREINPDLILRAARDDADAQDQFLAAAADPPGWRATLRHFFALGLEETHRLVVDTLREWREVVFRAHETDLAAALDRDATAKRHLSQGVPPDRLIELVAPDVRCEREAHSRRIILIPTVIFRPWVLLSEHGDARLLCYPAGADAVDGAAPPSASALVRLYQALADEHRLRMVRLLASRGCTLQEMADELAIGKSLAHHHLAILRAASVVRLRVGADKRYDLHPDLLALVAEALARYIAVPRSPGDTRTLIRKDREDADAR